MSAKHPESKGTAPATELANQPAQITAALRKDIYLEEQIKLLSEPMWSKKNALIYLVYTLFMFVCFALPVWLYYETNEEALKEWKTFAWPLGGAVALVTIMIATVAVLRRVMRTRLETQRATNKTELLQERLKEEDFVTTLVQLNFKYIDKYYLQTQVQANSSFTLCAAAAVISLALILLGIGLSFFSADGREIASMASMGAGVLGEFISAVFFYLYNRTIAKMGEYHQKLVLTQNIALALKIVDDLKDQNRVAAQTKFIEALLKDINAHLTGISAPESKPSRGPGSISPK